MRAVAIAVLLLGAAASAEGPLSPDEAELIRWFGSLGYPDLAKAPFVRIRGRPLEYGFLIREDGETFEVFTVGLRTLRLARRPGAAPGELPFEGIDLAQYVREGLHSLANPPPDAGRWESEPFGHRRYLPKHWFRVLAFAVACARAGHPELAHELLSLSRADAAHREAGAGDPFVGLSRQVADEALRNLMLEFGDPTVPWEGLLARCRWWKEKFGPSADSRWVDAMVPMLEEIVDPKAKEPDDPTARLVLRLPETMGWLYRGGPIGEGPGVELARMGPDSLPKLLEAWDDARPSRSLVHDIPGFGKGYLREAVEVATVGGHVRRIVEEIAGREFRERADAVAWYEEIRRDGEEAVLVRAVSSGGNHAAGSADRLLERHPAAAEQALVSGIARAKGEWMRETLVWKLRAVPTEAATRLLLDELRAKDARRRVVAAWLLLLRDRREGVRAVVESSRGGEHGEGVAHFLAMCGAVDGVAALEERFPAMPLGARVDLAWTFLSGDRGWAHLSEADLPPPDEDWAAAVESVLVRALADDVHARGTSMSWGRYWFTDPRVCDVAACALAERFPDRYAFDPHVSIGRRDRRLAELRNAWRTRNGLPEEPVPGEARVEPLPADTAAALREAFRKDGDAFSIERHGLSAFPFVSRWLAEMAKDDPARESLKEIRRRLGCLVVTIDAPEDPGRILARLKDMPLTAGSLVTAVLTLPAALPEGVTGFSLFASRDQAETGVVLRLRLERDKREPGVGGGRSVALRVGSECELSSWGSAGGSRNDWAGLEWRLKKVLDGDPSVAFEARLRVER